MIFLDNDYALKFKEARYKLKVVGSAFDGDLFIEVKDGDSITYRKDTRSFVEVFLHEIENGDIIMSECNQILAKQGKPYPRTCAKCGLGQCTEMVDNTSVNNLSNNEIDKIAKVCYETIRAYCMSIGDNSQLPWGDAPGWQISTVRKGVKFLIENPNALPSDSHDSWIKEKRKDGWKYGPVKDPEKKEHPCFMLYEDLPKEEQIKDYLFTGVVKAMLSI